MTDYKKTERKIRVMNERQMHDYNKNPETLKLIWDYRDLRNEKKAAEENAEKAHQRYMVEVKKVGDISTKLLDLSHKYYTASGGESLETAVRKYFHEE